MVDRSISAGVVVACTLWVVCLGLWGLSWVAGEEIGRLSLIFCGAAATATIRSYIVCHEEQMKMALTVTSTVGSEGPLAPVEPLAAPRRTRRE